MTKICLSHKATQTKKIVFLPREKLVFKVTSNFPECTNQ